MFMIIFDVSVPMDRMWIEFCVKCHHTATVGHRVGATVHVCGGCTGTTVNINLLHLGRQAFRLFPGNDIVELMLRRGVRMRSSECLLVYPKVHTHYPRLRDMTAGR